MPTDYFPPNGDLTESQKREEHVPIHIECIRTTTDSLEGIQLESLASLDEMKQALERNNELLASLDHFQYNLISREAVWLRRICWILSANLVFAALQYFS